MSEDEKPKIVGADSPDGIEARQVVKDVEQRIGLGPQIVPSEGSPEQRFGPWLGVPRDRQLVCAVEGCTEEGRSHLCPYDGAWHHHGCIHYGCPAAEADVKRSGLVLRKGWGLLCNTHYTKLTGGK